MYGSVHGIPSYPCAMLFILPGLPLNGTWPYMYVYSSKYKICAVEMSKDFFLISNHRSCLNIIIVHIVSIFVSFLYVFATGQTPHLDPVIIEIKTTNVQCGEKTRGGNIVLQQTNITL